MAFAFRRINPHRYRLLLAFMAVLLFMGQRPTVALAQLPEMSPEPAKIGHGLEEPRTLPESKPQIELSFAPLVRQAAPAVVNIYTKKQVLQPTSPLFNDPFFRRFFGGRGLAQKREQTSLGSGVVVRSDGLIVTNEHVINGADEIRVVLSDRREYSATPVIEDERTDLAVLRITDEMEAPLPALELADSDAAEVGDLVLAIGNPFGVGQTVSSGIISALARTDVTAGDFGFFIQTDAAINPGNSGGALLGMDGRLLGINSAIYSRDGGSLGIGFAIPANLVRTVVLAAEQGGELHRPWIGADGQVVTPDLMRAIGIDRPSGVLLTWLYDKGPASKAGLQIGDVVLAIDDKPVDDPKALRFRVATLTPDRSVTVEYWRDDKRRKLSMTPIVPPFEPAPGKTLLGGRHPLSGVSIANLSPGLAEQIGFTGNPEGAIIAEIDPRSIARRFGFRVGDVVLSVNGEKITTVDQLAALMRRPADQWAISLRRGDRVISATLAF